MSFVRRVAGRIGSRAAEAVVDVQATPASWGEADQPRVVVKVDQALQLGTSVLVGGWSTGRGEMRLAAGGTALATRRFTTSRPDVARYLGREDAQDLGFVLLADHPGASELVLQCIGPRGETAAAYPLAIQRNTISADARTQLEPAIAHLRQSGTLDAKALRIIDDARAQPVQGPRFAVGVLDDVRASDGSAHALVSGWLVKRPGTQAWLEDSRGNRCELEGAFWTRREDVAAAVPGDLSMHADHAGFLVRFEGVVPGDRVRLMARDDGAEAALAEQACAHWSADPVEASRWLFAYPTPLSGMARRIAEIDLPTLEPMLQSHQHSWDGLPLRSEQLGSPPPAPLVSIVIPLHGRLDFVEHQLLEFARDAWLLENAEVLYVVDDPALVTRMAEAAWDLHRLYGVAFRWIWGGTNRGFAGANNLGAQSAKGTDLVFLNSDAFPRRPGWLQSLTGALAAHPELGAVGPRLLYADGSIQHAGMAFRWRADLSIWTNHHPCMGLSPTLDPHGSLAHVPAVTGACLAMRKADFDRVGGWDTGYLIGDFEDSDLCLKLTAAGMRIGYLPQVELTHLERQSFKLLGEGDFRTRVVVYNAVRHQQRWQRDIEASAMEQAP